jgi:D-alanyl-D-alanine carboxypeptidase
MKNIFLALNIILSSFYTTRAKAAVNYWSHESLNSYNTSRPRYEFGSDFENEEIYFSKNQKSQSLYAGTAEQWGNYFVYISPQGERTVISEKHSHDNFIPASNLKLLTAYNAFKNKIMSLENLSVMLHTSSNSLAEAAFSSLSDSKTDAINLIHQSLQGIENSEAVQIVDGSGYSTANKLSPVLIAGLLEKIYFSPDYNDFKELLAQPGQFGTLEKIYTDIDTDTTNEASGHINIYGKTGTLPISRVKCFSGYVESEKGVLIFSIMANNVDPAVAKIRIEQMIRQKIQMLKTDSSL